MAVGKTFTSELDPTNDGLAVTYVLPATECDLSCAYCFIRQRNEAVNTQLSPQDYVAFLEDTAAAFPVRVSGIQGYEPLLPETWPYTTALLESSGRLGIASSLVTNGTRLSERAADLAALGLNDITVSLDAADAAAHDRLRGVDGAFNRTVEGIRVALRKPQLADRLVVASVLLPKRRHLLDGLPRCLAELGVPYFGVTPLIKVPLRGSGWMVQAHNSMMRDLDILCAEAERYGVRFVVDDELNQFRHILDGANRFMVHSLGRPDRLVRLTPSGAVSVGTEVLERLTPRAPRWFPSRERAADFLRRRGIGQDLTSNGPVELQCAVA